MVIVYLIILSLGKVYYDSIHPAMIESVTNLLRASKNRKRGFEDCPQVRKRTIYTSLLERPSRTILLL